MDRMRKEEDSFLEGLEKFFLRKQMRSDQGMKREEIEGIQKKKIEHKGGERKEEKRREERRGKRLKDGMRRGEV